ncbi:MAG: FKBP-type peptidyl-prolyl cis-trans isomerase [Victivallaceae bacterium]|jgi:FKBP-type peptidyl-prolyl cis-trans isomerase FklB
MSIEFKTDADKTSYALGMNIGESLVQLPAELNAEILTQAIKDLLAGNPPALPESDYVAAMKAFQAKMQAAEQDASKEISLQNAAEEKSFMEDNKKAEGVVTTASGLQYIVLKEGSGARPVADDTVKVHYAGTLLDGTEFDSSVKRGQPAEFGVTQVIKGWTEALQLMNVGSKYRLFVPSKLAYGERGAGQAIGPCSMLVFDVELIDIL